MCKRNILISLIFIICSYAAVFSQTALQDRKDVNEPDNAVYEKSAIGKDANKNKRRKNSDEIIVKGDIFKSTSSAYTVNIIDSEKIKDLGVSEAANIVKAVPGVVMKEYGQGLVSNTVSMRGFTGGVHGDDLGIYLDGIPLNETMGHGGGYADPNIVIPLEIDQVMIYKGPSTAMYGNFSKAGTMAFYTRKKEEYDLMSLKFGSFKTSDVQIAVGEKVSDNVWNNTAVQFYRTDGYMENTGSLMGNASTRFTFEPAKNLEISVSLRGHGAIWDGTGYITKTQSEDRDKAFKQRPSAENDGGERTQFCERFDAGYKLNNNIKINYWAFGSETDWVRWQKGIAADPAAEQQVEHNYDIYKAGSGININYVDSLLRVIGGLEYYSDGTDYNKWNTVERVRDTKVLKYENRLDNYVLFAEGEANIHPMFRPTIGLRVDSFTGKIDYSIKDNTSEENKSFGMSKYTHISPKIGFRSTMIENTLDLRGNVSNGYAMPKSTAIFGGSDIKPSSIWQYEAGTTLTFADRLTFDAAAFIMDTDNEIQADPNASSDVTKYSNAGETRRIGSEIEVKITPVRLIELYGNFAFISSDVRKNRNTTYEGKELSGLPKYSAQAGFKAEMHSGLGLKGEWLYVGKSYLNSLNTLTYGGYNIFNAGLFYKLIFENNDIDITFEIKNILNRLYASTYSANDSGTTTSFSPGLPRSYYGSVNMRW